MQDKKRRKEAVAIWGRTDGLQPQEVKQIKKNRIEQTVSGKRLDRIMDVITSHDRTPGGLPVPAGVHAPDLDVIHTLYRTATRDNSELPSVYCPNCKTDHHEALYIECPETRQKFPVMFPSIAGEKNSLAAAKTLIDKRFAQKQMITGNLEVKSISIVMVKSLVGIIQEFVPKEKLPAAQMKIDAVMEKMEKLEVEE